MSAVHLNRLIAKKDISSIIREWVTLSDAPVSIWDADSNLLFGREDSECKRQHPVKGTGKIIGWVDGDEKASLLASVISFAAVTEQEKRALGRETLNKYRELIKLFETSQQISHSLLPEEVAHVALDRARHTIKSTAASIMVYSEKEDLLQVVAGWRDRAPSTRTVRWEEEVAAVVMKTGTAEIINNVNTGPGDMSWEDGLSAIMCAPLKSHGKTIGVFTIGSHEPCTYFAEDLQLFSSIASQTATALTNAQHYEQLRLFSEELAKKNVQLQKEMIQREQTEDTLRKTEEKYRLHFENVIDVIYSVDADLKIVAMSPSVERIMGYAPDELVGRAFPDLNLLTAESLEKALADTQRILKGEKIRSAIYEFIAKDGSLRIGEVSSSPLFEDGKIVAIFSVARDITERIQAQKALNESEERFRTMAENIMDGLVIVENGKVVFVNNKIAEITGYAPEELIALGKGVDLVVPEEQAHMKPVHDYVLKEGSYPHPIELWISRRDGTRRYVSKRLSLITRGEGLQTGYEIVTDITEKKKAADEIKETRDFLDNIIETSLDSIVVSDRKGYLTRVNSFFLESTGYAREEVLGKHISEFAPPAVGSYETVSGEMVKIEQDFFDNQLEMMAMLRKDHKVANWEAYYHRKDGKLIPVEQNIIFLQNQQGEITGSVGISRDVTERRKAEGELKATRDFLEDVFRTSIDGIIVTDSTGAIRMINEAAVTILGYSPQELLGQRIHGYLEVGAEGKERGKQIQKVLMEKGAVYGYEHVFRRKDGNFVAIEMSIALLKDHNGNLTGGVTSLRDITERKEAEKKILAYQDQLRSLASQLTLTEEQERRRIATDLHDRIGQMLAISKIKLGALRASTASLGIAKDLDEIRDLIEQSIQDTRSLIFDLCPPFLYELGFEKALEWLLEDIQEQYGITTHFECAGEPYQLDDDLRILLYQSVRELFINIVKHAQAQHARLTVQREPTSLNLCVEDDGRGFVEPTSAFHFDKEGGFGLFRIQERFHYLGGEITIDSKPHQGTRISLKIPFTSAQHLTRRT